MKKLYFTYFLLMASGYYGQSQNNQDDWFYNPFNKNSAHHRAIGTGAIYADVNHPAVKDWLKGSQINMNVGTTPWGLYMIVADENGPILTVNKREPTGTSGLPADMRFPSGGVDIDFPSQFDGNITVYDRTIDVFNHLRVYAWNNGAPTAIQYRSYEANINGHGSKLGDRIGTSASGIAAPFGILRGWEVNKIGHPIGHALQMVLPYISTHSTMMLSREVWWPAVSMDGRALTDPNSNTGNIPYGSLWAIPPVSQGGPDLSTLGLSEKGMRLAQALRDYGVYAVDGGSSPSIRADQDFTAAVRSELVGETKKFYKYLRLVTNSVPEEGKVKFNVGDANWENPTGGTNSQIIAGEFPAGGGTPLAPNTAIDANLSSSDEIGNLDNSSWKMKVYPNPATEMLTIEFNKTPLNASVVVFSILGQPVKSQSLTDQHTTLYLPEGQDMYFVRVISNRESRTFKVVRR